MGSWRVNLTRCGADISKPDRGRNDDRLFIALQKFQVVKGFGPNSMVELFLFVSAADDR